MNGILQRTSYYQDETSAWLDLGDCLDQNRIYGKRPIVQPIQAHIREPRPRLTVQNGSLWDVTPNGSLGLADRLNGPLCLYHLLSHNDRAACRDHLGGRAETRRVSRDWIEPRERRKLSNPIIPNVLCLFEVER
jgi:hypothetical protein